MNNRPLLPCFDFILLFLLKDQTVTPPYFQNPPPNVPLNRPHPLSPSSHNEFPRPCSFSSRRILTTAAANPTLNANRGSKVLFLVVPPPNR